jgi:hypothetical protein
MNSVTPPPFGDPTQVKSDHAAAIKKGIGCSCGGCLAIALAAVGVFVLIFAVVMYSMRSADGTQAAVTRARADARVLAAVGEPLQVGWIISGSVSGVGVGSTVEVSIPLSGPAGEGTLVAHGWRETEQGWSFTVLSFTPDGADGVAVNLLTE